VSENLQIIEVNNNRSAQHHYQGLNFRDWGLCIIYVNSDVFGIELSKLFFAEQRTYQNDDGEMGRFIGLCGSRRRRAALKMLERRRRQKAHGVGHYIIRSVLVDGLDSSSRIHPPNRNNMLLLHQPTSCLARISTH
jgi:hypothetical protein